MKPINNDLIRSFGPCYDPSEKKIPDGETLSVLDWVEKYRSVVPAEDIIWLLCSNEFMAERDLRLFAVWCAREALSLIDSPDPRSVAACGVAERYANGEASQEELAAARAAADAAARATTFRDDLYAAARAAVSATGAADFVADAAAAYAAHAAHAADSSARAYDAATDAADAAREKQLNQLLTYFNYETNNN